MKELRNRVIQVPDNGNNLSDVGQADRTGDKSGIQRYGWEAMSQELVACRQGGGWWLVSHCSDSKVVDIGEGNGGVVVVSEKRGRSGRTVS